MKGVLALAAAAEAATGLIVLIEPALVVELLFGVELTGAGALVGRLAGIALIGLGVACWPGESRRQAPHGMLAYGTLVTLYLLYLGVAGGGGGVLLWPAVAAHLVIVVLPIVSLRRVATLRDAPSAAARDMCLARGSVAAVACTLLLAAAPAEAHLSTTGLGPVYDGLTHFLSSPEDLVSALALALLAGLRGVVHGRRAVFVLPAAWLLGILCGLTAAASSAGTLPAAIAMLVLGGLVVADAQLSLRALSALAALLGGAHGFLNGSGMGVSGASLIAALGVASAVFVVVVLVAAFVATLRAQWARIAVRVGGSWIAASGLLMLGWAIRAAMT